MAGAEGHGLACRLGRYFCLRQRCPQDTRVSPAGSVGASAFGRRDKRHKRYLIEHKKDILTIMQMNGTLQTYLADISEQAEDMYIRLIKDMETAEGVTEQLKAENQMLWVQKMNNIRIRATEIVNKELIYV